MADVAPFEAWYFGVPMVTRFYMTAAVLTTTACYLHLLSPLKLYFDFDLIVHKLELWRLVTAFFYFGGISIDFIFHMFFLVRYSRMLEEGCFRNRPADYLFMLLFGATFLVALSPFVAMYFLGPALVFMMVYVWARKNPMLMMNFMGMFNFRAPWLPWVLLGVALLLTGQLPAVDLLGIAIGHLYFYIEDIYPKITRGRRILHTPRFLVRLLQPADFDDPTIVPFAEEFGGGGPPLAAAAGLDGVEDETQAVPAPNSNNNNDGDDSQPTQGHSSSGSGSSSNSTEATTNAT